MKAKLVRDLIAESVWANLSANDVEQFCVRLGMRPADDGEHPFNSKRKYVMARLNEYGPDELLSIAKTILEEWDDPELERIVGDGAARGVDGSMRNLIFAANGPKPKIVLKDAINNIVEVVENGEHCLFYDRALSESGLTWQDLTAWWKSVLKTDIDDDHDIARHLWERLHSSLQSDPERLLFRRYSARYGTQGFEIPALIPQVYLHYDPYTLRSGHGGALTRQRMDFLLLLPGRERVVIEVDGKQHYSDHSGRASAAKYSEMVAEDRELRLAGYEVYRFGGHELSDPRLASSTVDNFFDRLLSRG